MAAADPPIAPLPRVPAHQRKEQSPIAAIVLVGLVFMAALFSIDNILLDVARAGWQKIQLIEGSFAPSGDPQKLYKASVSGKIPQYDPRIIDEAVKERQLNPPNPFNRPPS